MNTCNGGCGKPVETFLDWCDDCNEFSKKNQLKRKRLKKQILEFKEPVMLMPSKGSNPEFARQIVKMAERIINGFGMNVLLSEEKMTVGEAPVGLLKLEDGCLIVKTEYYHDDQKRCMCFLVSSGEYYCGDGNDAYCQALEIEQT